MAIMPGEIKQSVKEAEAQLRFARVCVNDFAGLARGNLRLCDYQILCDLKKELRGFNAKSGRWSK